MNRLRNVSWLRLLAEGVAIVASILLAFAIDAWWQERQQRIEEQQLLQGLGKEFAAIRSTLAGDLSDHLRDLGILEAMLVEFESGPSEDVVDHVNAVLLEMLMPQTSDVGGGALEALLNSGRTEILSSNSLRARLAGWDGVMGEVWDDQANSAKMVFEIFVPYFVDEAIGAGALMGGWYDSWPISVISPADDPVMLSRLLGEPKFRVLVELRYGYKRHLTGEFEAAIAEADTIIAEIEMSRTILEQE